MKLVILTECSQGSGFGHLTRCLAIADEFLVRGYKTCFLIKGDHSADSLIKNHEFKFLNWIDEIGEISVTASPDDILLIDSYSAENDILEKLSSRYKYIACFDDTNRLVYPTRFVINSGPVAKEIPYPVTSYKTKYLCGLEYHPLRKEFLPILNREIRDKIKIILVIFGGSDVRNLALKISRIVHDSLPGILVRVISPSNMLPYDQEVKDIIRIPTLGAGELKQEMILSDVVISGGGQTIFELASTGSVVIAISMAENQNANLEGWKESGFLGTILQWDDKDLATKLKNELSVLSDKTVREQRSQIGHRLVDGIGTERIIATLLRDYLHENLVLRKITKDDIEKVYELSNDPEIRRNSINPDTIIYNDHVSWFEQKLNDQNCLYMVSCDGDTLVGQVRYDVTVSIAIISISVGLRYRGYGLAKWMIKESLESLKKEFPVVNVVRAFVRPENIGSISLFRNSGFTIQEEHKKYHDGMLLFHYSI